MKAIRRKLQDLTKILEELRDRSSPASAESQGIVARFADNARDQIERLPQRSLVRPAAIALRNLSTSLRGNESLETVTGEVEAALEAISELLGEPTFGISPEELRKAAAGILHQRGALACTLCRAPERELDIMSLDVRPFPADKHLSRVPMPVAMLTCATCGFVSWHSLKALGVM